MQFFIPICLFGALYSIFFCPRIGIFCFDFTHFGIIFLFFAANYFSGGCINASPAGKRRIANGIQQQQFGGGGDDGLFGISGKLSTANDISGNNAFGHITPATTAITAIAIAACILIISVFAIVFVILQVRIKKKYKNTYAFYFVRQCKKNHIFVRMLSTL